MTNKKKEEEKNQKKRKESSKIKHGEPTSADLQTKKITASKQNLTKKRIREAISSLKETNEFIITERPYDAQDIKNFQKAIQKFNETKSPQSIFSHNDYYEFLVKFQKNPKPETFDPQNLSSEENEKFQLHVFNKFREIALMNKVKINSTEHRLKSLIPILEKNNPESINELRDLLRENPLLNQKGIIHYQGGLGPKGMIHSGFVHCNFNPYWSQEGQSTKSTHRLYLNPPFEAIPKIIIEIFNEMQAKFPIYFKYLDFNLPETDKANRDRLDKIVIFTNPEHLPKIIKILEKIESSHPDWFENCDIPTLTAPIIPGVGLAEEATMEQAEIMNEGSYIKSERTSFNRIRAELLEKSWLDTIKNIVYRSPDLRPRKGRSMREIFNDFLKSALPDKLDQNSINELIKQVWDEKLNYNALKEIKIPNAYQSLGSILEKALKLTLQDTINYFNADSLVPYIQYSLSKIAPHYKVDPQNIALNLQD